MVVALYKTKKLLKESVGKRFNGVDPSMFGSSYKSTGTFPVVGPSAYERKWYAQVTLADDIIVKVK